MRARRARRCAGRSANGPAARFADARSLVAGLALLLAVSGVGCEAGGGADPARDERPAAIGDAAGAVCGMLVREQTAPRAQVVHRDGERAFLCSLGDLLVHLDAPSPHGAARAVFVEVLAPEEDPAGSHPGEHAWRDAADAFYVVGVDRPGVMGAPVLAYATRADAEAVAGAHTGARVLDLDGLRGWWRGMVVD